MIGVREIRDDCGSQGSRPEQSSDLANVSGMDGTWPAVTLSAAPIPLGYY